MRTVRVGVLALTLVAMSTPAPALAEVEPFAAPPDRAKLVEEEQRVWSAGDDLDRSIRRARNLYRDEALTGWLQSMLDALYPEFRGSIVLRGIVRDADPNAFVLPNGSVYLTLGLVGRMPSEAQLAMVLGHEAAHFVYRHGYQRMSSAKPTASDSNASCAPGIRRRLASRPSRFSPRMRSSTSASSRRSSPRIRR